MLTPETLVSGHFITTANYAARASPGINKITKTLFDIFVFASTTTPDRLVDPDGAKYVYTCA